jgi:GT2 family glycosyltransferase
MMPGLEIAAWCVALGWWSRVLPALLNIRRVPDLCRLPQDAMPERAPSVTVIVPARDEAAAIERTLRSLAAQTYPSLQIFAIDDRSTDATGSIMETVAGEHPSQIQVIHVTELPAEWTGKTHAMALAARRATSDWLLFTDGDGNFAPNAVALALAQAEQEGVDHFVLIPTMEIHSFGEGMILGFFQTFSLWISRPWKVSDPKAKRDIVGIGAFNMIRREAYERIGGFEALRMEILEDMRLAHAVKKAGMRSQVSFGRDLLRIHWAAGIRGLVGVLTKNMFAGFRFRVELLLATCLWMTCVSVLPVFGLLLPATRIPAAVTLAAMVATYQLYARRSGIPAWYMLTAPAAAAVMVFTLLKSMFSTLWQGGVVWRGTFYPLAELRRRAGPMW